MKRSLKNKILPWMAPVLGCLGMGAMWILYTAGTDGGGLLLPFHGGAIAVLLITAVMAGGMLYLLHGMEDTAGSPRLFPDSRLAAVGTLAAAIGILVTAMDSLSAINEPIRMLSGLLKIVAGIALIYLAWCRWNNVRGSFLAWAVVTAYLLLRIMFEYRSWSSQPELIRFFYPLLGSVCTALAMYHRTAFAVKLGSRKQFLFFSQVGAFCCLVALPGNFEPFYLGMALWAMTDLCSRKPLKHKKPETPPEEAP